MSSEKGPFLTLDDITNRGQKKDTRTELEKRGEKIFTDELGSYGIEKSETNSEVSGLTAALAGVASGIIKIPEGVVSLGAELIDLGAGTSLAKNIETFFDKINPFEEVAQQRATGKLIEAVVSLGVPATAGAKIATRLAEKAIKAKRTGTYLKLSNPNVIKGGQKAQQLNKLSGKQRFAAIAVGGAAGETFVTDVEQLGSLTDAFFGTNTFIDINERQDPQEDAARKLMNRLKFASESLVIVPSVYAVGYAGKALYQRGRNLAYSSSQIDRTIDKVGGAFRPRGLRPQEQFLAKERQQGRKMADLNFAREQTRRIDIEINKIFPDISGVAGTDRKKLLKDLDELLFAGDLKDILDPRLSKTIAKTMNDAGATQESVNKVFAAIANSRGYMAKLLNITAEGPAARQDLPAGIKQDLKQIMGKRVKDYLGSTYEIFDNKEANLLTKFKPTTQDINQAAKLFQRYGRKNGVELTDEYAKGLVNRIIRQVEGKAPSSDPLKGPFFSYENLTQGAQDPFNIKTFKQTLEKNIKGGGKELQVIGKGSKTFRKLFGEVEDARHSIFEAVNRLSMTARKNQLFDEILDADEALKAAGSKEVGRQGFFFSSPLEAQKAFGPNADIVPVDTYLEEFFKNGILVNRLKGTFTDRAIAEGFTNVSNFRNFLRGESGGFIGKTLSWGYRNLLLTPKAGAQYAKTILSVPTHIRNFLSSGAFTVANGNLGTLVRDPKLFFEAMRRAGASVQVGLRQPLSNERYRKYLELGVVNTNTRLGDLRNLMKDVRIGEGNIATDKVLGGILRKLGRVGKGIKKTAETAQDLYVAEDDFWKVINYEVEFGKRQKAYEKFGISKTVKEIEEEAADIVKNTIPNYARVGEFVRAMRASPFGNFMSWSSEMFRTSVGIVEQALKDLKNPATRAFGLERLIGFAFMGAVLPYGMIKGSQAIFGVSQEEADAANNFVAPWAESGQKIYVRKPDDPNLYYINYSQNNVYDTVTQPFQDVLREVQRGIEDEEQLIPSFIRGIAKAAGKAASPYISESIYTEAFLDIVTRNGVTNEGVRLYNEQTPTPEKVAIISKHLAKTLLPSTGAFERTAKAITGKPGKGPTIYEIPDEFAGVFGWRLEKIDPKKGLGFEIYRLQKGQRQARQLFTGGQEGVLSGEIKTSRDVIERYFIANQQLFEVERQARKRLKGAKTLGLKQSEIEDIFDERGISLATPNRLIDGEFKPYRVSPNIQRRFEKISEQTGRPNPYLEAEPTLDAISDAFENQSLSGPNRLELKDFLPKQQPSLDQGRVQPTPQPNPTVVTPPVRPAAVTQTGLTPTEEALLSPSEKAIRLRQRGLG